MASNLPRHEVTEQALENLLIEAVSLLVQRQRDAEERSAAMEARLAELEARLAPGRPDERLAILRDQLNELRSEPVLRPTSLETRRPPAPPPPHLEPVTPPAPPPSAPVSAAPTIAHSGSSVSAWSVFGTTPAQRFSLLLIAVGVLALLYSAFLLLRFG